MPSFSCSENLLGDGSSSSILLSIITEFTNEFCTVINGNTNDLSPNELSGCTRTFFFFHELFNVGVKSIDPFDQVKDGGDDRTILYLSVCAEFLCRYSVLIRRVGVDICSLRCNCCVRSKCSRLSGSGNLILNVASMSMTSTSLFSQPLS